jgi:hypothetical protein
MRITKVLADKIQRWKDLREEFSTFLDAHRGVIGGYHDIREAVEKASAEVKRELETISPDAVPPGEKSLEVDPMGFGISLRRDTRGTHAEILEKPALLKKLVEAGVIKPPTAAAVERAVKEGKLGPEVQGFLPDLPT